jgi:hypothetical protein
MLLLPGQYLLMSAPCASWIWFNVGIPACRGSVRNWSTAVRNLFCKRIMKCRNSEDKGADFILCSSSGEVAADLIKQRLSSLFLNWRLQPWGILLLFLANILRLPKEVSFNFFELLRISRHCKRFPSYVEYREVGRRNYSCPVQISRL